MSFKVHAQNFLGFADEPLDVDFSEVEGLVFIGGENKDSAAALSNGAGKSTILDAILWGLYGITSRGLKYDEVVNTVTGKDCIVKVTFSVGGSTYQVYRTRLHEELGNSLHLTRISSGTDKSLTGRNMGETQDEIDRVLGIEASTMIATTIFGQDTKSFVDYKDADRKKVLTALLQYDILDEMLEETEARIKVEQKAVETFNGKIDIWNPQLKELRQADFANKSELFETNRQEEIDKHENSLKGIDESLKEGLQALSDKLKREFTQLTEDKAETEAKVIESQREIEVAESRIIEIQKSLVGLDDAKNTLKQAQRDEGAAEHAWNAKRKELEQLEDIGIGVCPHCRQDVTESHIEGLAETLRSDIEVALGVMKDTREHLSRSEATFNELDALRVELGGLEADVKALSQSVTTSSTHLLSVEREIENMSGKIDEEREKIESHFTSLADTIKGHIASAKERENPYESLIQENEEAIAILEGKIEMAQNSIKYAEGMIQDLFHWKVAFGKQGIRSQLFDRVVNLLDSKVHEYMNILSEGAVTVTFDTETQLKGGEKRDKFTILVSDDEGSRVIESYSGGEKKRIKLAIDLALSDIVCEEREHTMDFAAFDEVLSGLDDVGRVRAMDMWRSQIDSGSKRLILVIDHSLDIQELFDSKIMVHRENKNSRVILNG